MVELCLLVHTHPEVPERHGHPSVLPGHGGGRAEGRHGEEGHLRGGDGGPGGYAGDADDHGGDTADQ
ncbi:hypothetical protein LCGC14_1318180 [marine sediment metagenome]|uniref:Uncharacterized protein n=1 Tax=marine sediment metagenome TaxID=412755 RepID=A0A0F9L5M9_9ZZZZ